MPLLCVFSARKNAAGDYISRLNIMKVLKEMSGLEEPGERTVIVQLRDQGEVTYHGILQSTEIGERLILKKLY